MCHFPAVLLHFSPLPSRLIFLPCLARCLLRLCSPFLARSLARPPARSLSLAPCAPRSPLAPARVPATAPPESRQRRRPLPALQRRRPPHPAPALPAVPPSLERARSGTLPALPGSLGGGGRSLLSSPPSLAPLPLPARPGPPPPRPAPLRPPARSCPGGGFNPLNTESAVKSPAARPGTPLTDFSRGPAKPTGPAFRVPGGPLPDGRGAANPSDPAAARPTTGPTSSHRRRPAARALCPAPGPRAAAAGPHCRCCRIAEARPLARPRMAARSRSCCRGGRRKAPESVLSVGKRPQAHFGPRAWPSDPAPAFGCG